MYVLLQDANSQINNFSHGPSFKAAQILPCCIFQSPVQRQAREQLDICFTALQKTNKLKLVGRGEGKECGHSHLVGPGSSLSVFLGLGLISPAFGCPQCGHLLKDGSWKASSVERMGHSYSTGHLSSSELVWTLR